MPYKETEKCAQLQPSKWYIFIDAATAAYAVYKKQIKKGMHATMTAGKEKKTQSEYDISKIQRHCSSALYIPIAVHNCT